MRLNKTQFIGGLQCEKQLHLCLNHPELAKPTQKPAALTGQVVERHARLEFPGGVLIERGRGLDAITESKRAMANADVHTLFEAGFLSEDLELFVDVLSRDSDGWVLTEIKASTKIKSEHIDDVAIQALALNQAGVNITRYELMHVDNAFVYGGDGDYHGLFKREDITEKVLNHVAAIESDLERLKAITVGALPDRHLGSQCKKPYPCPYIEYCELSNSDYPVAWLPRGQKVAETLIARGIYDIRDIPVDALKSENHLRVRRVTIAGEPELLSAAAAELSQLGTPRYYLDFESIQFAIPIWEGTTPFSQLPFQWSCHIEHADGSLEHHEFLGISGENPRRQFAESMIEACAGEGPIIVYFASFEKRILRETAEALPDLAGALGTLSERVFDLLPVVQRNFYHPQMKGSWSIKKVLPALVPELNYADLGDVQDGTQAQSVFFDLINSEIDDTRKAQLRTDLIEYCKLDTLAMVKIADALSRAPV